MIPTPIRKVLSSIEERKVRALLMGGQACVLYGAAEFSRDTDRAQRPHRALLRLARPGGEAKLAAALNAEEWAEHQADARYWAPLKAELERLRRDRRS